MNTHAILRVKQNVTVFRKGISEVPILSLSIKKRKDDSDCERLKLFFLIHKPTQSINHPRYLKK